MNTEILNTEIVDGIAVVTLGSPKRLYFDAEMGDALTGALETFAGDHHIRVVIITGGAPGNINRHFDIPALIKIAEGLRAAGREWPENATYNGGFFDKAMALCETMPKPVIAAISGTAIAGAFEFTLACDLRVAEDGDYLLGLPEVNLGLLPGAGGTQRLPRTIGTSAALMHILMGVALSPREAERKGLVHLTVDGKAVDEGDGDCSVACRFFSSRISSLMLKRGSWCAGPRTLRWPKDWRWNVQPVSEIVCLRRWLGANALLRFKKDYVAESLL